MVDALFLGGQVCMNMTCGPTQSLSEAKVGRVTETCGVCFYRIGGTILRTVVRALL